MQVAEPFAEKEISMEKVNIADKFKKITEYWKPYIAGELNGCTSGMNTLQVRIW